MKLIHLSLLSLLALPLAAQDTGFSVGGGLIAAPKTYFGAYDKVVNNNLGYYVNGAYTVKTAETDLTGRFTASLSSMPGKSRDNGLKTSLSLFQVSADLVFPVGVEGLSGVFGVQHRHREPHHQRCGQSLPREGWSWHQGRFPHRC
jgi:hypothetical protein